MREIKAQIRLCGFTLFAQTYLSAHLGWKRDRSLVKSNSRRNKSEPQLK